jgi:hypothetical protein
MYSSISSKKKNKNKICQLILLNKPVHDQPEIQESALSVKALDYFQASNKCIVIDIEHAKMTK